ncbi:hypothetical protein RYX36_033795 [Vicia faba]
MHRYGPPYAPFYSHGWVYTHPAVAMWLSFRDYEKSSAANYAKDTSEKISNLSSWNSFERGQAMKIRWCFIIVLLHGAFRGLAYMHDHDKLQQSLGPFSISLNSQQFDCYSISTIKVAGICFINNENDSSAQGYRVHGRLQFWTNMGPALPVAGPCKI